MRKIHSERHRVSLNAIRVFEVVARTGSLTTAGAELGVTSSAVSHQLRKLEEELGVRFFLRGNNTISLTDLGLRFYREIAPAIGLIERSAAALYRDEMEICVDATTSLALRWLIPSLDRFRALFPKVRIRVETYSARRPTPVADSDISIRYFRTGENAEGWEILAVDVRRPVAAPALLARSANTPALTVASLPILQCARGNWDWSDWCETVDMSLSDLSLGHQFDTDDAGLHGCVAGLGVMLAPTILTRREIRSGSLAVLPGCPSIETGTYRYKRRTETKAARQFCDWMIAEMQRLE